MEKKYRINGATGVKEVAVLVSAGFGAGWYSWGMELKGLFDPIIVDFVNAEPFNLAALEEYLEKEYPDYYCGGIDGLYVKWLPEGTDFIIDEYDGSESLSIKDNIKWITA